MDEVSAAGPRSRGTKQPAFLVTIALTAKNKRSESGAVGPPGIGPDRQCGAEYLMAG